MQPQQQQPAPRRTFIKNLHINEYVRIMGTLVDIGLNSDYFVLDDGSGSSVAIVTTHHHPNDYDLDNSSSTCDNNRSGGHNSSSTKDRYKVGLLVDCVGVCEGVVVDNNNTIIVLEDNNEKGITNSDSDDKDNKNNNNSSSSGDTETVHNNSIQDKMSFFNIRAESIAIIQNHDARDIETLRTFEILESFNEDFFCNIDHSSYLNKESLFNIIKASKGGITKDELMILLYGTRISLDDREEEIERIDVILEEMVLDETIYCNRQKAYSTV